jgi:hypothetical protein
MNIYYAMRDDPGSPSVIIGAFSSDEKAMGACQEDADEESDGQGEPLTWQDDSAKTRDGSTYWSRMLELDQRTRA